MTKRKLTDVEIKVNERAMLTRFLQEHIRSLENHEDNWDD